MPNLPYLTDYLDVKHLPSLTGGQFDQVYLSDMAGDHTQAVSEFETASQNLSDPDLKKFATKTLPTPAKTFQDGAGTLRGLNVSRLSR
jgi:predicted outer membrane protein